MSISELKPSIPDGFDGPTALPRNNDESVAWQRANREWWESHPMRYDFTEKVQAKEFTEEFYREIDNRFFLDVKTFMPWKKMPFDPLIDFESLQDKDVLEIGVGNGSHAQLISVFAKSYTGIDLTNYAVQSTTKRLQLIKNGAARQTTILSMDAEQMEFPDESFDFVWSWGVIHHSANTRKVLEEIERVLKPGGTATVMVYHRSFWSYHIFAGLFGGLLRGKLPFRGGIHRARQQLIDGAIARYYTRSEWRALVSDLFTTNKIEVYGSKQELLPMPSGKLKDSLRRALPDWCGRFLTNRCKLGMFLVTELRKRS